MDTREFQRKFAQCPQPLVIDVREPHETAEGMIPGALNIPRGQLVGAIKKHASRLDREILLYCAKGTRSEEAAGQLRALGYSRVNSLTGGFAAWQASGGSIDSTSVLTAEQMVRYKRHLLLPEIRSAGQEKL